MLMIRAFLHMDLDCRKLMDPFPASWGWLVPWYQDQNILFLALCKNLLTLPGALPPPLWHPGIVITPYELVNFE